MTESEKEKAEGVVEAGNGDFNDERTMREQAMVQCSGKGARGFIDAFTGS